MASDRPSRTLEARVPFVHFFDGFRTSPEVNKIEQLDEDDMRGMITTSWCCMHIAHAALSPIIQSCAAPLKTRMFTSRDAKPSIPITACLPEIVQKEMDNFAKLVGRQYHLFDYIGAPDAETCHRDHGLRR